MQGDRTSLVDWSKWDAKLGKVHDGWIATRIGLTPQAVSYRRRRLGIQPLGFTAALQALRAAIIRALKTSTRKNPLPVRMIHAAVVADYGAVAFRTIQRHLRQMVNACNPLVEAIRAHKTSAADWGYVLTRKGQVGGRR